ncbi:uncharacterized protein LOC111088304 isoform X2 [Limulus polyphemus]|uniref:Uncharacterized protein LOC111088304 isoform X2 n=1 Tax=Limulus polyphemus TaxID=6850 RepID=A0ABM1TCW1_LIMPO|nr:uncharacterized protein LOC111088304 isoform X2 [Limulus polyphemus]
MQSKQFRTIGRERSVNGSHPDEKEEINKMMYVQVRNMAINKENSWTSDNPSSPQDERGSLPEGSVHFQQTSSETRDFVTLPTCTSCRIQSYGSEMRAVSPDSGEMKTNDNTEHILEVVRPFSPLSLEVQQVISATVKDSFCRVGAASQDHSYIQESSFCKLFKVGQEEKNESVEHKENTCSTVDDVSDLTEELEDVERSKEVNSEDKVKNNTTRRSLEDAGYEPTEEETRRIQQILSKSL